MSRPKLKQIAQSGAVEGQVAFYNSTTQSWQPRIRHNLTATTNPGPGDDVTQSYEPGSVWINTSSNQAFICTDSATGAADWQNTTAVGTSDVTLETPTSVTTFTTIAAALAASSSGDAVVVGPGTYAESISIPAGVTLRGRNGPDVTTISGGAATGTRVSLDDGSVIKGFTVVLPTDATSAIEKTAGTASSTVQDMAMVGAGASGCGITNSTTGAMTCRNISYLTGTCDSAICGDSGIITLDNLTIQSGTLANGIRVAANASVEVFGFGCLVGTDGVQVAGNGTFRASGFDIEGTNSIHITGDDANVTLIGGDLDPTTTPLLVDPGITTGRFIASSVDIEQGEIDAPSQYLATATIIGNIVDDRAGDEGSRFYGELAVGLPEKGAELVAGEGDSYIRGMVVLTTDATATSTTDGGNFVDVTSAARSPGGSTFAFQGTAINHTILIGNTLTDASSAELKFRGIKAAIETGVTTGSFVFEVWTGAAWTEIATMSINSNTFARYADTLFLRSSSSEQIRFGQDEPVRNWASKTINSTAAKWARIRITSAPSTSPVFQQFKLSSNRTELNADGYQEAFGRARWRATNLNTGNVFGESGGVVNGTFPIGTGAVPNAWDHQIKNSIFNGAGDAIYFQTSLPRGIDTSSTLDLEIYYITGTTSSTTAPQLIVSAAVIPASGVPIADPSGSTIPIPRPESSTPLTTAVSTSVFGPFDIPEVVAGKVHRSDAAGLDISEFYEGDPVFIRLEFDSAGSPATILLVTSVELSGLFWTMGERGDE